MSLVIGCCVSFFIFKDNLYFLDLGGNEIVFCGKKLFISIIYLNVLCLAEILKLISGVIGYYFI